MNSKGSKPVYFISGALVFVSYYFLSSSINLCSFSAFVESLKNHLPLVQNPCLISYLSRYSMPPINPAKNSDKQPLTNLLIVKQ